MNNRFNNIDNYSADYSGQRYSDPYLSSEGLFGEQKLFADAYDFGKDRHAFSTKIEPVLDRQLNVLPLYELELKEMIACLYIEMLFMAAIYGYYQRAGHRDTRARMLRPYDPDALLPSLHWGPHFNHFQIRPRKWLGEMEKSGQALSRDWQNWTYENSFHNRDNTGLSGRLISDARHNLGRPVWAFTRFASQCQAGNLGCAATVSELLQEAGVKIPGSASVYGVVDQLQQQGWQRLKISDKNQFRPGDVVFGLRGSHGHIGIISQVNNDQVMVCDNSSSASTLKERTIENGGSFTPNGRFAGSLYVMRPPPAS